MLKVVTGSAGFSMERKFHGFGEILHLLYSFSDDIKLFHFPFVQLDLIAWLSTKTFC